MNYVRRNTVRKNILLCFAMACGAWFAATPCLAQKAATPVVVIDLNKVFEAHPAFRPQIDAIKARVKGEEAKIQQQGEQLKASVEKLSSMDPSSADYKQLETQIARSQGQIQADMALKRKGFLEEEAQVYYNTYLEVQSQVKTFAEGNRISIVLRHSSEEIDPTNRQSVLAGINQPIVYNQGGLDITKYNPQGTLLQYVPSKETIESHSRALFRKETVHQVKQTRHQALQIANMAPKKSNRARLNHIHAIKQRYA